MEKFQQQVADMDLNAMVREAWEAAYCIQMNGGTERNARRWMARRMGQCGVVLQSVRLLGFLS